MFITAVPITKLLAWGEGDSGGHVLRETTSRGLSGLVCPSRSSERGQRERAEEWGLSSCAEVREKVRGEHGFSSLLKQKIEGKNCAVFCFAGKRKIFFIYL